MASPTRSTDAQAIVIATRCSFETVETFDTSERELRQHQHETAARDIRRTPTKFQRLTHAKTPTFVSSVKSPSQFTLNTDAARRNDHAKTLYKPPSDFVHRIASPPATWTCPGDDFVAKFQLASNQDLRSRAALDQEGFFSDAQSDGTQTLAATQLIALDYPDARRPPSSTRSPISRPAFQASVPHTTRKSANVALRLETIVDQDGLLPPLSEIRGHQFRDDLSTPASAGSDSFLAAFKPAPSLRPMGGGSL